jgi:hypothetical protein
VVKGGTVRGRFQGIDAGLFHWGRVGLVAGMVIAGGIVPGWAVPSSADLEFFEREVRPVLAEKCYKCHSGDSKKRKAGHWSWHGPKKQAVPTVTQSEWPLGEIDHYMLAKLEAARLPPFLKTLVRSMVGTCLRVEQIPGNTSDKVYFLSAADYGFSKRRRRKRLDGSPVVRGSRTRTVSGSPGVITSSGTGDQLPRSSEDSAA